jgi:hypothetical protein
MKRTHLVLAEHLLEEATRLSAQRTYSKTVGLALAEFVRRARVGKILALAGSGLWEGDLPVIRDDAPKTAKQRARRAARGPLACSIIGTRLRDHRLSSRSRR